METSDLPETCLGPVAPGTSSSEISSKGKITIRFNREKLKDQKLLRTLAPQSVGMALEELAFRKQAHLVYHSENHVLEWFQPDEMLQRFIF